MPMTAWGGSKIILPVGPTYGPVAQLTGSVASQQSIPTGREDHTVSAAVCVTGTTTEEAMLFP